MRRLKVLLITVAVFGASFHATFSQAKEIIVSPEMVRPNLPFSSAVRSGDLLYLAGTIALDKEGRLIHGGIEAQTKKTLENLGTILNAAEMDYEDVVAVTVCLSDSRLFKGMNQAYRQFFRTMPPVRATVEADLVRPGALVEISMIAANPAFPRQVVEPPGWSTNPLPYSKAIHVGDYLFLAGLVSQDPQTGRAFDGDIQVQVGQALENARTLVQTAGFEMSDMTVSRVWLEDSRDFQAMNEAYGAFFTDVPPTRATVQARLMGTPYKVEIMLSGVKGERQPLGTSGGNPFSPAIKVGNRLFVSGIVRDLPELRGDIRGQTRAVLEQIRSLVQDGDMSLTNVVDATVWITDVRNFGAMNEVYREFFPQDPPARTTVGSALMSPAGLVEISVIAAR